MTKNRDCLYYAMFIDSEWAMRYYSMAYHSIKSLSQVYDDSFDVVLHYYIHDGKKIGDISIDNKYNLAKDFPFVNCVKTDYCDKYNVIRKRPYKHDSYMFKWYSLQSTLCMGYKKIFFLDCDSVFIRNPSYFFRKYNDGYLWTLSCVDPVNDILYPTIPNMNSGQFIVDAKSITSKKTLYSKIVKKRTYLAKQAQVLYANNKINDEQLHGYEYFNEQYCGQFTLMDMGLVYKEMDYNEITHPADAVLFTYEDNTLMDESDGRRTRYNINLKENGSYISDIEYDITVLHYSSGKSIFWVPRDMQSIDMKKEYDDFFRKKLNSSHKNNKWELLFQ